jgi:ABC-type branched-subunit amino acid transport system substrate-binding protein
MRLGFLAAATLSIAAIALSACGGGSVPQSSRARPVSPAAQVPAVMSPTPTPPVAAPLPAPKTKVSVAILLPLSGREAALGGDLLDAAQLAVFEVGDGYFQLMPRDTAAPGGARGAVEAAAADGARLILGPVFATDVTQAAPAARAHGLNLIAFSNDSSVAGPGAYLIGITPDQQIKRIIGYAYSQGLRRFAALVPEGQYGARVHESLRRTVNELGAQLVSVEQYSADGGNLNGVVRRLAGWDDRRAAMARERKELEARDDAASKEALRKLGQGETLGEVPFDAVLIPEGGARLAQIAPLLSYYDIDPARVKFLGLTAWEGPELGREPALIGAWYVAPPRGGTEGFESRFRAAYGRPSGPIARLAYDATALAALLARRESGPDFSDATLTASNGYLGSAGIFRFRPSGEAETGLAVFEVRSNGVRVTAAAPESFLQVGQ